ncbi:uncharacterized protein F5147DRAFT_55752 [Suillus discolor]|uniref:Uncharacterized protein n=1 Tax=Suillus discolor TaxID=1912936 RepID=A0A9P7ETU2_9AGAM|nr:uncharacterized protein F5147DRAFT_55752 [Suillus discolor]KAG2088005.1 hypothetical protein F5147DRAFT_55752 [Suillus discolor]
MRLASRFKTRTSDSTPMRQGPCVKSEKTSASDVPPDHEGSCPSPMDTCTTHATSSTPDDVYDPVDIVVTRTIICPDSNSRGGPRMLSRPQMVFRWMFSRSPSSTNTYSPSQSSSSSVSLRSTPPSRFASLVLRALNCLSPSSAFDRDADDMKAHRTERPISCRAALDNMEIHM